MAFAPSSVYKDVGDGSIVGRFVEKDCGNLFEFSENNDGIFPEFPYKVWVANPIDGLESGYRYAKVLKTVAYLAVDEDEYGNVVVDKWNIKAYTKYAE